MTPTSIRFWKPGLLVLALLHFSLTLSAQRDTANFRVSAVGAFMPQTGQYQGWDISNGTGPGGFEYPFVDGHDYNCEIKVGSEIFGKAEGVFNSFTEFVTALNENIKTQSDYNYALVAVGQIQLFVAGSLGITLAHDLSLTIEDRTLSRFICNETTQGALNSAGIIKLRWGPENFDTWQKALTDGYSVVRYTVKQNGTLLADSVMQQSRSVLVNSAKPKPASYWEGLIDADSTSVAGLIATAMYGDSLDLYNGQGGKIMQVYHRNEERLMRLNASLFAAEQSFELATDLAWGCTDFAVDANSEYLYVVSITNFADTGNLKTGATLVLTNGGAVYPIPSGIYTEAKDKKGLIFLPKGELEKYYSSYSVLRSDDGGSTYQPLSLLPQLSNTSTNEETESNFFLFTDTFPLNNYKYLYRIKGKTAFGGFGPLSDTVSMTGKPGPLEVIWSIDSISEPTFGTQRIHWNFPDSLQNKISGFRVIRSAKADDFTDIVSPILPVTDRSYLDLTPLASNYYSIEAFDLNNYTLVSNVLLGQPSDTTPPSKPVVTTCTCTKSGRVTIAWNGNTEVDLSGYKVFMANDIHAPEYSPITGYQVTDTSYQFFITNTLLNKYLYLKVRAFDKRYNPSLLSEPCTLLRPDGVPPVPPVITEVKSVTKAVRLSWALSVSADADKYQLQRRPTGVNFWTIRKNFTKNAPIESIDDTVPNARLNYDYRLLVWDESNNMSSSPIVKAKADVGPLPAVSNFTGQFYAPSTTNGKFPKVKLQWNYANHDDLLGFQILRALDTSSFRSFLFISKYDAVYPPSQLGSNPNLPPLPPYLDCKFSDLDIDFSIPIRQTYFGINGTGNPTGSYTSPKPTSLIPNRGFTVVQYQVFAKFADGTMSELPPIVSVNVPN